MENKKDGEKTWFSVNLSNKPIDIQKCVDFVKNDNSGAIVSFGGTTRNSFQDKTVKFLAYEAYNEMALRTLENICLEAKKKYPVLKKIYIVHRLGQVPVCEESIYICLSTPHRKEAFEACEWVLEQVKKCAEIWKKEEYEDGTATWKKN